METIELQIICSDWRLSQILQFLFIFIFLTQSDECMLICDNLCIHSDTEFVCIFLIIVFNIQKVIFAQ